MCEPKVIKRGETSREIYLKVNVNLRSDACWNNYLLVANIIKIMAARNKTNTVIAEQIITVYTTSALIFL